MGNSEPGIHVILWPEASLGRSPTMDAQYLRTRRPKLSWSIRLLSLSGTPPTQWFVNKACPVKNFIIFLSATNERSHLIFEVCGRINHCA